MATPMIGTGPPTPYVPVEARPLRFRVGLRPLDPADWFEVDDARAEQLARKRQLLAQPGTVVSRPGSEAPAGELLARIDEWLAAHHPHLHRERGRGHPIEQAARLVQEDLCLLERGEGGWVLTAAAVCFPSRWSLASKLGRSVAGIHAPVPGYGSLAGPVDAVFDRLAPGRPLWRLNWTLLDDPELHQPPPVAGPRAVSDPGADVSFRVERQTLTKLAGGAAVFTIRTYVTPLSRVVAQYPRTGPALAAALSELSPEMVAYKGWSQLVPAVRAWLEAGHGQDGK